MSRNNNFRSFNFFISNFSLIKGLKLENMDISSLPEGLLTLKDPRKNGYASFKINAPMPFNQLIACVCCDRNGEVETFVNVFDEEFSFGTFRPGQSESKSKKTAKAEMDGDILRLKSKAAEIYVRIELRPLKDKKTSIKTANFVFTDSSIDFLKESSGAVFKKELKLAVKGVSQMARPFERARDICSPTSISCVLRYYKINREPEETAGAVEDISQGIFGNWLFNCAYANWLGLFAFAARLNSLREAQAFIEKRIPLIASITFSKDELKGAPLQETRGHLLVIKGFTKNGDVITADPAAPKDSLTEITYSRNEFEKVWLGNKYGLCYIILKDLRALAAPSFPFSSLYSDKGLKKIETQILSGEKIKCLEYGKKTDIAAENQKTLAGKGLIPYRGYADKIDFSLPEFPAAAVKDKFAPVYDCLLRKTQTELSMGTRLEILSKPAESFVLARSSGLPFIVGEKSLISLEKKLSEKEARSAIINSAKKFIKDKYVWGGKSAYGVDCSGLASLCYISAGIEIPRNARDQYHSAKKIDFNQLKRGDLIFSSPKDAKEIDHVMIYCGRGEIIEATMDCGCVRKIPLIKKFSFDFGCKFRNGDIANSKRIFFGSFI